MTSKREVNIRQTCCFEVEKAMTMYKGTREVRRVQPDLLVAVKLGYTCCVDFGHSNQLHSAIPMCIEARNTQV